MTTIHRLSRIFQPIQTVSKNSNITNKDVTSKSQRLLLELGLLHQANPGSFHFLPLALKSLNKIVNIVDEEMQSIGGQKLIFPTLVKQDLWEQSGRAKDLGSELMTLKDRHNHEYILAPTYEETATHLLSTLAPMSYKKFPLLVYQITSKFRDEIKPRFGLIRGREFMMKDLYSFNVDEEAALQTYENVCRSYDKIFKRIGVDFVKVLGSSGAMGGNLSHEYHFLSNIGEDKILTCQKCHYTANMELVQEQMCPQCGETTDIDVKTGIEVGHTFFLAEKYSEPLKAHYKDQNQKSVVLQMGSYGIGISRILAAALECLSLEKELRWPDSIAPYNVVIIPPKKGSKEEMLCENVCETLISSLETDIQELKNNVLIDDRTSLTIGRRFLDSKRTGYRYIIVLNKKAAENPPTLEFNDIYTNQQLDLGICDILSYIKNNSDMLKMRLSI